MLRRTFLGAVAALGVGAASSAAKAQTPPGRLKAMTRDTLGTTLSLALDHAPFPVAGAPYHDDTTLVFVPAHFRYRPNEGVAVLVHFHGHNTTAERAIVAHELREQLAESRQNAVLIVPQLAYLAADSACGKLEAPGGLARLVREALSMTARVGGETLGESEFSADAAVGTVCLSAHSGGYHAAACSLRSGGLDVRETYLFDALYSDSDIFRDWVIERRGEPLHHRHKLVSYFLPGAATDVNNRALQAALQRASVLTELEGEEGELSRHELSHAEAVFVQTSLYHSNVTWETNALRDCLFASALPRHLSSNWFSRKDEARSIDRRR